jgi:hypothetical protein
VKLRGIIKVMRPEFFAIAFEEPEKAESNLERLDAALEYGTRGVRDKL